MQSQAMRGGLCLIDLIEWLKVVVWNTELQELEMRSAGRTALYIRTPTEAKGDVGKQEASS